MSNRHPWTAWYWDEWDTDTAALSDSEYAIYHRLLKHYYKSQKPLEANATGLPRLCSAHTKAQLVAMKLVLVKFFTLQSDSCYHNKRADIELERMLSVSNERAEAGRRGGNARAKNVANATGLPEQKPTQPQPHIQRESKAIEPNGSRIPENFSIDQETREWALAERLPNPDDEICAFVDYWISMPGARGRKLNWKATFRNWLRRSGEMKHTGGSNGRKPQTGASAVRDDNNVGSLIRAARGHVAKRTQNHRDKLEIGTD